MWWPWTLGAGMLYAEDWGGGRGIGFIGMLFPDIDPGGTKTFNEIKSSHHVS